MKHILVIDASPRKGGNTDVMADATAAALEKAGAKVSRYHIRDMKIQPCLGCNACKGASYVCVQKDDMPALVESLSDCDGIVFASPVYFGYVSGPAKILIDRLYCLFNPAKGLLCRNNGKKVGVILTSSSPSDYSGITEQIASAFALCGAPQHKTLLAGGTSKTACKDNAQQLADAADLANWILG